MPCEPHTDFQSTDARRRSRTWQPRLSSRHGQEDGPAPGQRPASAARKKPAPPPAALPTSISTRTKSSRPTGSWSAPNGISTQSGAALRDPPIRGQGLADEQLETNERARRIPRQAKHRTVPDPAKQHRLSRPHPHTVKDDLPEISHHRGHVIPVAHRSSARQDHHVGQGRLPEPRSRAAKRGRPSHACGDAPRASADSIAPFESRICPSAGSWEGWTISSPVVKMLTRTVSKTSTPAIPLRGKQSQRPGFTRAPSSNKTSPASKSPPSSPDKSPASLGSRTATFSRQSGVLLHQDGESVRRRHRPGPKSARKFPARWVAPKPGPPPTLPRIDTPAHVR